MKAHKLSGTRGVKVDRAKAEAVSRFVSIHGNQLPPSLTFVFSAVSLNKSFLVVHGTVTIGVVSVQTPQKYRSGCPIPTIWSTLGLV